MAIVTYRRAFAGAAIAITVVFLTIVATLVASAAFDNRTFVAPTTAKFVASHDPGVIAHGRALALGPAACVACHGENLAGGRSWKLGPIGRVYAPNITPSPSGIATFTDAQLARALRYGVSHEEHALFPFMRYEGLADDDVVALISFLRSTTPVDHPVPPDDWHLLGHVARAWFLKPKGPLNDPPLHVVPSPDADYGGYLANSVAGCVSCHTKHNPMTGGYSAALLTGGFEFREESGNFISPDLTGAPGSPLAGWNEQRFIDRFRQGGKVAGSPMPWRELNQLTDVELRAIFRYITSPSPGTPGNP